MKPIHKFNGGRGATLCHSCRVIITEGLKDYLYCSKCDPIHFLEVQSKEMEDMPEMKYHLIRSDKLQKKANDIAWIEWNEDGTFKAKHDEPAVGRSLILDGQTFNYTWLTTPIKEILEQQENFVSFTTKNSQYKLYKL